MAVRSWDELRLLRLARRVFTVVKNLSAAVWSPPSVLSWGLGVVSLLVSSNKTDLSKKKKKMYFLLCHTCIMGRSEGERSVGGLNRV